MPQLLFYFHLIKFCALFAGEVVGKNVAVDDHSPREIGNVFFSRSEIFEELLCRLCNTALSQNPLFSFLAPLFQTLWSVLFVRQQIRIFFPDHTIPDNGIYLLVKSFAGKFQIST